MMIDTDMLVAHIREAAANENPSLVNWFELRALALLAAQALEEAKEAGNHAAQGY